MTMFRLFQVAIIGSLVIICSGACTFPSDLRGTWISSEKGTLEFTDSYFTGYQVASFATSNFTCLLNSGDKYVVQSESFVRFGLNFYAFMCLDLVSVTSPNLYRYYKASEKQTDANDERVVFRLTTFADPTEAEVCTVSSFDSSYVYSVLMKNNTIDEVKAECPIPFLGDFTYTYDTGSGNLCNDSLVKVCAGSKDTMTWDYGQCSQIQAYSASGVTNCIYSTSSNDVYTVHVYNTDTTVDGSTTYRFTCYRAKGYDSVEATQYPGNCPDTMNETYAPSPGGALVLTSEVLCAYPVPVVEESSTLSAGVIAAIVIICLLIVIAIIAGVIYYLYTQRKKRKQAEWEAANRKVDPDALSPNMRLGLPDETRYDLDRLMYSPENMKNGLIKRSPRKEMMGIEGLEGYNEGEMYMDEDQRQTALEAHMFAEKRKRKDKKDEFDAAKPTNKVFSQRIKDLAQGRKRPFKAVALAKLRLKPPRARPLGKTPDPDGAPDTKTKDIVIQVEEADGPNAENKRKTRFADEEAAKEKAGQTGKETEEKKKAKKLEDVETLSDIVDNENAVDGLSDDEKEPRLILPNLRSDKKGRRKRVRDSGKKRKRKKVIVTKYIPNGTAPFVRKIALFRQVAEDVKKKNSAWHAPPKLRPRSRPWSAMVRRLRMARNKTVSPMPPIPPLRHKMHDRSSQEENQQTQDMPHNTRFMPPKSRRKLAEYTEPMPLTRSNTNTAMTPLQRIHRKDNPRAWRDAFGDDGNGMESVDLETLKKRLPENRWKKLLEELYKDKKYFDYVQQTTSNSEKDLMSSAQTSLQYLYGRALFWEQQEPIPVRPPSHVKRMYSRYERPKSSSKSIQRSSTMLSRSGHGRVPRTPSTQVSRLKRRETMSKTKKSATKKPETKALPLPEFFEGGTQTDFSPIPLTPVMIDDTLDVTERLSLHSYVADGNAGVDTPIIPFTKEVTRSDIKLEEYDNDMFDQDDPNFVLQPYKEEDEEQLTAAV